MMAFMFANALTAAPVVAAEGAAAMTAAEILAAEQAAQVLAAQTLAAEQAAALAAQQATAATANTAAATATNAATNQSILNAIGAGGGAPATAAQLGGYGGINSIGAAGTGAGTGTGIMGAQTLTPAAAQTLTPATAAQTLTPAAETAKYQFSQAELDALARGQEMARLSSAAPPAEVTAYATPNNVPSTSMLDPTVTTVEASVPAVSTAPVESVPKSFAELRAEGAVNPAKETWMDLQAERAADPNAYKGFPSNRMLRAEGYDIAGANPDIFNPAYNLSSTNLSSQGIQLGSKYSPAGGVNMGGPGGVTGSFPTAPPAAESGFMKGISSAMDYMDKNPFKSAIGAYAVAKKTGMLDEEDQPEKKPYDGILSKYKMSSDFKGRQADPQDYQYTPKAYNMASGGIASYRRGGDLSSQLDHYEKMTQTKAAPAGRGDPGIVFDTDPDTRSLDPVTAAQVRMAKVNKRANLQIPSTKRPTPMGQLNLIPVTMKKSDESPDTVDAAQGGVMSLGGYAAGGNPRLLRGPGDGMSDNIPATIAGKQPARLADGEFVIPADVVSHLGNGSTEAGAKKLHKMMNDVRKARTGNPKQGKQINPNKFMPK
jgi:hypothetical protein